jgi:hypothetical protein
MAAGTRFPTSLGQVMIDEPDRIAKLLTREQ